jgi:hypothetical protein
MAWVATAIIVGSLITAGTSLYGQKQQQKQAQRQMDQQKKLANEEVRMSEEKIQGEAIRSSSRQERAAMASYGRSDQIGVGAGGTDLISGLLGGGGMTLDEGQQQRNRGSLLGS